MMFHDVKVAPELAPSNLFSITSALNTGFILGNDGKTITVKKGSFNLKFDHEIKTKSGYVAGAMIEPHYTTNRNKTEVATPNKVTELYKVGCCESKIAGAMVDNIIFVARLSRCRKEENHSSVVRVTFLGTTIVVPVHLVHPLRWGFASPPKLGLYLYHVP
jgi:hypothetical protein